ncbi:unnamed protein product [Prorocentrum cordatum]|uniref:Uncharacterized protein n=1 Tax=Prorocentrum cordatum TaxID=2364126 RepID=A0ABN9VIR3_9DINO|nr:unnamed protein product [Polarella glacialis]
MADFTDAAYNKYHAGQGAGVLIGNWHEEQVIREATGEGRTVPQRHLPRSGLLTDFTKVPNDGFRKMDNTFERVYGPKSVGTPGSTYKESCNYDNDAFKTEGSGPKDRTLQSRHLQEAERLVQEEEAKLAELANARSFETTTTAFHGQVGKPS